MRMVRARINLELLSHLATKLGLGQHAANRQLEHSFRMPLHEFLGRNLLEPTWPAGMMTINFVLELIAGEDHLFGIDNYHVIANVEKRCVACLSLTHQQLRRRGRKPPNSFAVGVNQKPLAALFEVLAARNECLHAENLQILLKEDERKEYEMDMEIVKLNARMVLLAHHARCYY